MPKERKVVGITNVYTRISRVEQTLFEKSARNTMPPVIKTTSYFYQNNWVAVTVSWYLYYYYDDSNPCTSSLIMYSSFSPLVPSHQFRETTKTTMRHNHYHRHHLIRIRLLLILFLFTWEKAVVQGDKQQLAVSNWEFEKQKHRFLLLAKKRERDSTEGGHSKEMCTTHKPTHKAGVI